MKIISLQTENVKRLKAVRIDPEGSLVLITGKNGEGKSSVLDSIEYALGGKGRLPGKPVRDGEERAVIVTDLGDLVVRRVINPDGTSSLKVTNAEGVQQSSPQAILDKLTGALTFDPLEFSRMKPRDQADTVRILAGLDFEEADRNRVQVFEQRTVAKRTVRDLEGQLEALPVVNAPDEEVSVTKLFKDLEAASEANRMNQVHRGEAEAAKDRQAAANELCGQLVLELANAETALGDAKAYLAIASKDLAEFVEGSGELVDVDTAPLREKIATADETNKAVRAKKHRVGVQQQLHEKAELVGSLTGTLMKFDEAKERAIAEADLPIEGLGIEDNGITLDGVPFEQASTAEKLRTSVAMGLALNPELRILLVRDGSSLDSDSLRLVAEMAEEADAQVWVEKVTDGEQTGIVIEDGEVRP